MQSLFGTALRRVSWNARPALQGRLIPAGLCLGAAGGAFSASWTLQCEQTESGRRKVAIYGGAFDPVTNSHMTVAAEIIHSGKADEVWLVPSGPRPDKPKLTKAAERYCMAQVAVNSSFSPGFPVKVSNQDVEKTQAAYTYDMLVEMRERNPDCDFAFVIGSDWLQPGTDLSKWDSVNPAWKPGASDTVPRTIITGHKMLDEFDFLITYRPGYEVTKSEADPTGLKQFGPRMFWLDMPHNFTFIEGNLSSSEIRKRIKKSYEVYAEKEDDVRKMRPVDGLLPMPVIGYIYRSGLYKK